MTFRNAHARRIEILPDFQLVVCFGDFFPVHGSEMTSPRQDSGEVLPAADAGPEEGVRGSDSQDGEADKGRRSGSSFHSEWSNSQQGTGILSLTEQDYREVRTCMIEY